MTHTKFYITENGAKQALVTKRMAGVLMDRTTITRQVRVSRSSHCRGNFPKVALLNCESNISPFEIIRLLTIHRHNDVLLPVYGVSGRDRSRHARQLVFP